MARTTVIEGRLAKYVAALPAVAADAGGRVYPFGAVPQGAKKPYLTYHRVGGGRLRSTKGTTTRVSHPTVQWDVWGEYGAAKRLADALRQGLEDDLPGHGLAADGTLADLRGPAVVWVQTVVVGDDRDDFEPARQGDEAREHRISADAEVWFEEG